MRQDSEQFIPHGTFLEPWAFVAQGVTGAAIERPFEGVVSNEVRARERLLPFRHQRRCRIGSGMTEGGKRRSRPSPGRQRAGNFGTHSAESVYY